MLKRLSLAVIFLLAACVLNPAVAMDAEPSYVLTGEAMALTLTTGLPDAIADADRQIIVTGEDHAQLADMGNDVVGPGKVATCLLPAHCYHTGPFEVGWRG